MLTLVVVVFVVVVFVVVVPLRTGDDPCLTACSKCLCLREKLLTAVVVLIVIVFVVVVFVVVVFVVVVFVVVVFIAIVFQGQETIHACLQQCLCRREKLLTAAHSVVRWPSPNTQDLLLPVALHLAYQFVNYYPQTKMRKHM